MSNETGTPGIMKDVLNQILFVSMSESRGVWWLMWGIIGNNCNILFDCFFTCRLAYHDFRKGDGACQNQQGFEGSWTLQST